MQSGGLPLACYLLVPGYASSCRRVAGALGFFGWPHPGPVPGQDDGSKASEGGVAVSPVDYSPAITPPLFV